ncbi:MAG: hypothetical protein HPY82_16935 [Gammaproteobacteria bacterium]|nr:hypothetical protein [Gammaproteobacteria bacterium]
MKRILGRAAAHSDECLLSYLIRVSEQNGFKHVGHLLHHAGLNWKNNRAPVHQILSGEFDVTPFLRALELPEHRSKIFPLHQSFLRIIDTPYLIVKFPKICPDCLDELGYCKYEWGLLPMLACTKHRRMLIDVSPSTGSRLGWYRQHLKRFDGEHACIKPSTILARPNAVLQSQYIDSLISGQRVEREIPAVLQGLSFREALSLIHFIAHYQLRLQGGSFNPVAMQNNDLGQCYQNVWSELQGWPDSFYALLSQYIDKPMSNRGVGGLNKHYRDLYERLYRQQENIGIARIKSEFDRYIETYWPGVLEPERITRIQLSTTNRNIISKKDAARILGSRLGRLSKLVQQNRLAPVVFKGKAHYLRDQVEALATVIASNWTMAEACGALQLTRYKLKQLLDAGIIPAIQKPDILNRDWVIDRTRTLVLIDELRRKSRNSAPPSGAVSMARLHRQGYSIVRLVLGMQSGELEYGCVVNTEKPESFRQFVCFKTNM